MKKVGAYVKMKNFLSYQNQKTLYGSSKETSRIPCFLNECNSLFVLLGNMSIKSIAKFVFHTIPEDTLQGNRPYLAKKRDKIICKILNRSD